MRPAHKEVPVVTTILMYAGFGLVAGLVARFLVPGPDPMGLIGTILLGVTGSFGGGFVYNLYVNGSDDPWAFEPSNFVGSVVGAIVLLILLRLFGLRGDRD